MSILVFIKLSKSVYFLESRGTGGLLMKVGSKRRRTKQEIADQKMEAMAKQQAIEDKLAKYE